MLVAGAVLFLIIGIKSKMRNNYLRGEKEAIITSPLAEAITELVGISGGISRIKRRVSHIDRRTLFKSFGACGIVFSLCAADYGRIVA